MSVNDRRRRPRGQAVVEFALIVPVLLLLLLIAVDFGRLFFAYISNVNAAREGAAYAAEHAADSPFVLADYTTGTYLAAVGQANAQGQGGGGVLTVSGPTCFSPLAPSSPVDCSTDASAFEALTGDRVTVSVSQPFTFLTPFVNLLFGGSLTLSASATAPVLNPEVAVTVVTPTTGQVNGTVTDTSSSPIAGATVTLSGVGTTTTNASGGYSFSNVTPGTYSVSATKTGYTSNAGSTASVTVTAGASATANLSLTLTAPCVALSIAGWRPETAVKVKTA